MNSRTLQAKQIVLQDEKYGARHKICELPTMESQPAKAA
jgi:hypothetical protein